MKIPRRFDVEGFQPDKKTSQKDNWTGLTAGLFCAGFYVPALRSRMD